ncbi:hypothetical protein [Hydrotalea sp.]|uniref:hypothetical protein n=1 Tax=Hydrotalea sp. TaxID=2881279 RepID=UPI002616B548|nr:hypothetical protein [Hydrotalea sp.]
MGQRKILISYIFLILLFLPACRKDVPKGQLIQATGFVIDSVKNKKLSDVTVYLYGAHSTFYGVYYDDGPLDSTISDKDGNFSIKYNAEGNSVDYALAIGNVVYGGYTNQTNYVIDISHPIYIFDYSYQLTDVALKARELNYARVNLKVLSNPYDTLYLDVSTTYGELFLRNRFIGRSVDTSFLTRYLPNTTNIFEYKILSSRIVDSATMFIRRMPDTLQSVLKDTIVISKIINTTYNIPLKPY